VAEQVRLVAVLGYSRGRGSSLHTICAARLAAAEAVAEGATAVVLSGWARRPRRDSEAELMRTAWRGPEVPLIADADAHTTAGNARAIAATARKLGATEVVAVTSSWHRPRARLLLRAALDPHVRLEVVSESGSRPARLLVRELACFAALPLQIRAARRSVG
jgi:uncharacterized SAM-binding protein YcdF (DUF218 family)